MSYGKAVTAIGVARVNPYTVPAGVVREQARIAASTSLNTGKRFFAYAKTVTTMPVILNSDDQAVMEKWLETLAGDSNVIWAGYFDNASKRLVGDSLGDGYGGQTSPAAAPAAAPGKTAEKGPGMGLILGIAAGGVGLMLAMRK